MRGVLRLSLPISLALLTGACHFGPPKPVLPDGLHRVLINPVSPVPAKSGTSALPDAPVAGGGR